MEIEKIVVKLSTDPFNPELNLQAAVEYERLNQTASAVSFYLRAAEYGAETHVFVAYTALLKMAHCFEDQKNREHTVSNAILQAIALWPELQEAYFLMAQFHERSGNWQECYTWAVMGLYQIKMNPLQVDVGYHGEYCLEFEKAISGWWVGRAEESKKLLLKLNSMDLAPEYATAVKANLERIGVVTI